MRPTRWTGRRSCARAAIAAALTTLAAALPSALAQEIPTVELGPAGPDQLLPIGEPFFLTGEVDESVQAVHAVFVRTSFAPFGLSALPDCSKVEGELGKLKENVFADPKRALIPGPHRADEIWSEGGYNVMLASGWSRSNGEGEEPNRFTIRVPDGASFFRPGARYCMLVYETKRPTYDVGPLFDAFEELLTKLSECKDTPGCSQAAMRKFRGALDELTRDLGKDEQDKVLGAFAALERKALPQLASARAGREPVDDLLRSWRSILKKHPVSPPPKVVAPVTKKSEPVTKKRPVRQAKLREEAELREEAAARDTAAVAAGFLPVAESPLAALLVAALERYHEIRAAPSGKGLTYYTPDGKQEVRYLKLGASLDTIEVTDDPSRPSPRSVRKAPLDTVLLPESTLSVLDMLEFARGRLRTRAGFVRLDALYENEASPSVDELRELRTRLAALQEVLLRVWESLAPDASSLTKALAGVEVYQHLGRWLKAEVLASCSEWLAGAGASLATIKPETHCDAGATAGWPGFRERSESPLSHMIERLGDYLTGIDLVEQARIDLAGLNGKPRTELRTAVAQRVTFSVSTWVFHYVTPSVGVAFPMRPDKSFPVVYGGIKVYLWPNLPEEPMWVNGAVDLRRAFALELGFGAARSDLGQDGRYSGPYGGSFPPVLVGGAVHVIPYTTFAMGAMFLDVRGDGPEAEPHGFPSFYVSMALDLNLFEVLAGLSDKSRGAAQQFLSSDAPGQGSFPVSQPAMISAASRLWPRR